MLVSLTKVKGCGGRLKGQGLGSCVGFRDGDVNRTPDEGTPN